jgi:hypothetical protein
VCREIGAQAIAARGARPAALPAAAPALYLGCVTESPLSARELRAAAETHTELGPEYRDALVESFVERVGREIDSKVDARLTQAGIRPPTQPPPPKPYNVMALALGSMALGIPLSAIVAVGTHPVGFAGLLVVWIAIAVINLGYAAKLRPPHDHR